MTFIHALISFVILSLSTTTWAVFKTSPNLQCDILKNGERRHTQYVQTEAGQKIKWAELDDLTAYVTEGESGTFEIEVFVAGEELRFYGSGPITLQKSLSASLWTRQQILDVVCGLK